MANGESKKRVAATKDDFLNFVEAYVNDELASVLGTTSTGDKKKLSKGKIWQLFKIYIDAVYELTAKPDFDGVSLAGVLRTRILESQRSGNKLLKIDVPATISEKLASGKSFMDPTEADDENKGE